MKSNRRNRVGAAAVEVALTLPILFMFTFAGWEFSRISVIRNTMENAAYEAAREAMLPGANQTKIEAAANGVLDSIGIVSSTIQVSPGLITQSTDAVTITIDTPLAANSLGVAKYFSSGSLTASITLSRELQPGRF